MTHPCLTCGACCASFRVDFSVHETQEWGGDVPDGLVVEVTGGTCRMRGTDHSPPRCAALTGKVGRQAACGIYEWRPSPCREFISFQNHQNKRFKQGYLARLPCAGCERTGACPARTFHAARRRP